jgi:hypothetical protein
MLIYRLHMSLESLGRRVSPALREQERLRIEAEGRVAVARFAAMFETRVPVPALPILPAPAAVEPVRERRSLRRGAASSRKARPSAAQKTCPDCLETVLKTATTCVYCGYDFERGASAWPVNGIAPANAA